MSEARRDDISGDLAYLASSMEALPIPDKPEHSRLAERRERVVRTVRQYLIPRIADPTAPLIVVFAGPTGAGKSTMLNSVIGAGHSPAGPIRPTTKEPVVLSSEQRADDYSSIGGVSCEVATGRAPILDELILVDTPDIDSTSTEHRAVAETMIDNADVIVFVNSALRYSDQVPWEVLRRARSRGVPIIHVMNRIRATSRGARPDYQRRLATEGLGSEVVAVQEHHIPRGAQSVPAPAVQDLRDRLVEVIESRRQGTVDLVRSVLDTTMDQAREIVDEAADLLAGAEAASEEVGLLLAVDIDRIASRREPRKGGGLDLRPLLGVGARRIRTKRMIRRRSPQEVDVSRALEVFDESVIAAVDADLRRQLHAGHLVHGEERKRMLADAHLSARSAVAAWRRDLEEMPAVTNSNNPPLVSLLLSRLCLGEAEPRLAEVVRLLAPAANVDGVAAEVRESLQKRLEPVYSGTEYRVSARLAGVTATRRSIDRVKASRWAVVARSSFSNA